MPWLQAVDSTICCFWGCFPCWILFGDPKKKVLSRNKRRVSIGITGCEIPRNIKATEVCWPAESTRQMWKNLNPQIGARMFMQTGEMQDVLKICIWIYVTSMYGANDTDTSPKLLNLIELISGDHAVLTHCTLNPPQDAWKKDAQSCSPKCQEPSTMAVYLGLFWHFFHLLHVFKEVETKDGILHLFCKNHQTK